MNNYQQNRHKMFVTLTNYLNLNKDKLKDFPRFKEYLDILLKKTDEISEAKRNKPNTPISYQ